MEVEGEEEKEGASGEKMREILRNREVLQPFTFYCMQDVLPRRTSCQAAGEVNVPWRSDPLHWPPGVQDTGGKCMFLCVSVCISVRATKKTILMRKVSTTDKTGTLQSSITL